MRGQEGEPRGARARQRATEGATQRVTQRRRAPSLEAWKPGNLEAWAGSPHSEATMTAILEAHGQKAYFAARAGSNMVLATLWSCPPTPRYPISISGRTTGSGPRRPAGCQAGRQEHVWQLAADGSKQREPQQTPTSKQRESQPAPPSSIPNGHCRPCPPGAPSSFITSSSPS